MVTDGVSYISYDLPVNNIEKNCIFITTDRIEYYKQKICIYCLKLIYDNVETIDVNNIDGKIIKQYQYENYSFVTLMNEKEILKNMIVNNVLDKRHFDFFIKNQKHAANEILEYLIIFNKKELEEILSNFLYLYDAILITKKLKDLYIQIITDNTFKDSEQLEKIFKYFLEKQSYPLDINVLLINFPFMYENLDKLFSLNFENLNCLINIDFIRRKIYKYNLLDEDYDYPITFEQIEEKIKNESFPISF